MAPFSKPETVLKQAEGLISVGQTHAALQSLTEMFSSKRFRSTPLAQLEPIMNRFVELCVDMRKGRTAKEGLMQYKNIAQNTSVSSIEGVIIKFIELADAKVKEAQAKADKVTMMGVDVIEDLEASETPESILLGAVSGDVSKDRTDRALVTPWLKFLWESYRTSLETLKNNARLELIYQQIAQQAFKFCLQYQRKVEFRRLCETLRLHLANVAKYSHQPHSINLSDPDILQHHLDTRFAQLNTSVELELWQEAFRSVEDVHNLLTMAKKAPRPSMMANYYEKLTKIFLMSGNALYHAAAWGRYFAVVCSIGGKSDEEMSMLAGQVLISALAVPVGLQTDNEPEELKGKNARLSALLGLTKMPTRAGLIKDALSRSVLKSSPTPLKSLYQVLEVTFDPLTLCSSVSPLLTELTELPLYEPYTALLRRALLSRLLSQLSQVYSTIKIVRLMELVAPVGFGEEEVEAYVMGCARRGELSVRVDHSTGSISFVDDAFGVVGEDQQTSSGSSTSFVGTSDGRVQVGSAEAVRTRLSGVANALYNSLIRIEEKPVDAEEQSQEKLAILVKAVESERKALHLRRSLVARRRELLSELSARKEKEETSRRAEISKRERESEEKRLKEEVRRRELERIAKTQEKVREEEAKKLAVSLVEKGLKGVNMDDMGGVTTDTLMSIQVAQLEKEKKERDERLRIIARRVDHIERAYRKVEQPLLSEDYLTQQASDKLTFESTQIARRDDARARYEEDMNSKKRMARMLEDYDARKQAIIARRGEDYEKRKAAADKKIKEEKNKRRAAVMKEREEEEARYQEEERIAREKEEEEARLEEERLAEAARLEAEQAEKAATEEALKIATAEKAAALRKEREAERAAAAEEARLKLKREEEAEARLLARNQEKARPSAVPARAAVGAVGAGREEPSAWRRSGTPTPAAAPSSVPPRSESPAPAPKFRAGGAAPGGGWRARQEALAAAAAAGGSVPSTPTTNSTPLPTTRAPIALAPRTVAAVGSGRASPAPRSGSPAPAEVKKDDDGFQTVSGGGKPVWKPRRGRA